MLAALEMILPGNAAKAASRLNGIRRFDPDARPAVDLASVDRHLAQARARLASCPSYFKFLKEMDPAVAETIRQWPALKKMFGL